MSDWPGIGEAEFLRRVGDALRPRSAAEAPPRPDPATTRTVSQDEPLQERFVRMAEDAGASVHRLDDPSALPAAICDFVAELEAKATIVGPDVPQREAVCDALRQRGCRLIDPSDADAAFEAGVGVTGVALAIAETGSIVLESGQPCSRLVSLAPMTHVAVVRRDQIVPDLVDWSQARRRGADGPAGETLITGPSKTADIELNLVKGVHGPGRLEILLL